MPSNRKKKKRRKEKLVPLSSTPDRLTTSFLLSSPKPPPYSLLPPPPPSASDLISDSSPLCSLSQAHLPPCYSLNVPNALLPQGLCTCSPPPMEHSSPRGTFFPQDSCNSHPLASFRSLLTYLLLREISPNTILLNIASVQPHSTLYFISPHNTYHPLKYILLVYLLIVSLLPLNINSMRAELFV